MRPFEWALFLSFLPMWGLTAGRWGRRGALAALLPLVAAVAQLVLEGARLEVLPLDVLAGLALLRVRPPRPHRWWALAGFAVVYVLAGLVPGWLLPVLTLPDPSGPHPVGVVDRVLTDPARHRRLMVTVWYPAARRGPRAPLFSTPDAVTTGLASAFGVPLAAPALRHLRYSTIAATAGAPALTGRGAFPVLISSHGMVGLRSQNSGSFQDLASWGYVVVAIDHTDAAAVTVFPDGEVRPFDLRRFGLRPQDAGRVNEVLLPVWVADQRLVYDAVARWQRDDPLLAGRLDTARMASLGHSFGGVVSLAVCRVDVRCRAAVNLDGGYQPGVMPPPAHRPLLILSSEGSDDNPTATGAWARIVTQARGPAFWLTVPHSTHLSLTVAPFISPLLVPHGADPRTDLRTLNGVLRAFVDRYVRGNGVPFERAPAVRAMRRRVTRP
ncbi:hypothetical protein [Deinococcus sonorensis]|uniref:Platelet-activating factor acetylhydrolase n=2 Tax=Deinococcus sonorensis TaxID=309891 RepID=A0AAU7U713_9DEIO